MHAFFTCVILLLLSDGVRPAVNNVNKDPIPDGAITTVDLANYRTIDTYVQRQIFAPSSTITIRVTDIPKNVSFLILQTHTFQYNITLSYDKALLNKISNESIFGSNIGLYVKPNLNSTAELYVKNDNIHEVDVLLVVATYGNKAPIPGGCNTEFNTEMAPYQKLSLGRAIVTVDSQPASVPFAKGIQPSCDQHHVQHEMYRMYLPEQDFNVETYFTTLSKMLTVDDIKQNSDKMPPSMFSSPMRRIFSAYPGVGSIHAVIATYENYSSAYVPLVTYACSPLLYPESCQSLNDTASKMFCGIIFFMGVFSVFLGHRFIRLDIIGPAAAMGGIIGYACAIGLADYETTSNLLIGLLSAIIGTILSSCIWLCSRRSIFLSMFSNIQLGFLCACITYYNVPDDSSYTANNWTFWPVFTIIMLIISIIMSMIPAYFGNALTCAIYGSFMMILPIDYIVGSNLKYVFINIIRRAAIPAFNNAIVHPPCQFRDISLIVLWTLLATIRMVKQYCGDLSCMLHKCCLGTLDDRVALLR